MKNEKLHNQLNALLEKTPMHKNLSRPILDLVLARLHYTQPVARTTLNMHAITCANMLSKEGDDFHKIVDIVKLVRVISVLINFDNLKPYIEDGCYQVNLYPNSEMVNYILDLIVTRQYTRIDMEKASRFYNIGNEGIAPKGPYDLKGYAFYLPKFKISIVL